MKPQPRAIAALRLSWHAYPGGNTLAAASGASLRDLMERMGHDSVRAATIYQHKTVTAGQAIADAISGAVQAASSPDDDQG